MDTICKEFPVTVYGNFEQYSKTISKARCRIFYKGANRNGTYITDEFAEKLLSTISYTPVKGIYDDMNGDYTDHGEERDQGRIYGIVPENPNLAWEKHVDEDGVEREYACVDVFIYTALYQEAKEIVGKSQSMELYDKSITGDWKIIEGRRYFVFEDACFLGLQALGDDVEPCFEGAAFFSLCNSLKELVHDLEACFQNQNKGGNNMPKLMFKLSDNQKFDFLWSLLNSNYNEENGWIVDYSICDIYDEYAVVRNHTEGIFERVYYKKDDSNDSLEIINKERCFIVDVNESEKNALDTLNKLNGSNFERVDEIYTERENLIEEKTNFEQKIEELNTSISTLTTERDGAQATIETLNTEKDELNVNYAAAQETITGLNSQIEELNTFKKGIELNEKKAILAKYNDLLSEEVIGTFTENIEGYNAVDLEKELAYTVMTNNPSVFSKEPQTPYIPKDNAPSDSLEAILSKYEKK